MNSLSTVTIEALVRSEDWVAGRDNALSLSLIHIYSDSPALPKVDNDRLFYTILEDYADISNKRDRMKKMKADPRPSAGRRPCR